MITEQDILDLKFTKLDYSTDDAQFYSLKISRDDIQDNAYNLYTLSIDSSLDNPHTLKDELCIGVEYKLLRRQALTTFEDKDKLEEVLLNWMKWDVSH